MMFAKGVYVIIYVVYCKVNYTIYLTLGIKLTQPSFRFTAKLISISLFNFMKQLV